jgi:N-glycosidase YbiA
MEGIETLAIFEEKVALTPRDLANAKINIQAAVSSKLAEKIEGKCSLHGWVVPNTVKLLSRSMGYTEKGRFTGDIVFHVQAQAKVLNPASGSHVVCQVTGNNMMGMYVTYRVPKTEKDRKTKQTITTEVDAIKVILPRDLHIGDETFSKIEIGETVQVEIKKSRFQVNDKFVLSVGVFEGKVGSEYVAPRVVEEENVVVEEAGPGEAAAERLRKFEAEERAARQAADFVVEEELPPLENESGQVVAPKPAAAAQGYRTSLALNDTGLPYAEGEPVYFNATKLNEYKELDNRFPSPFTLDGKAWPTVEHYYQASKFPTLPEYQEEIRLLPTATAAAKAGKTKDPAKPIRADWKQQREGLLRKAIFAKFDQNQALKQKLLETYPRPIVFADGNDSFWGYGRTKMGQNKLGTILMEYRSMNTGMEALNE